MSTDTLSSKRHGQPSPSVGKACLFVCALIWGSSFLVMKNALDSFPVCLLIALRFTGGGLLLSLVFARRLRSLNRRTAVHGAVCGVLEAAAYIVQTIGLKDTTPGKNAFLTTVYVVLVPFVAWGLTRRRPTRRNVAAALLCLSGIGLISLSGGWTVSRGDLLTLLSGVLFALQVAFVSFYGQRDDPILLTILMFFAVALCSWSGFFLWEEAPAALPSGALSELAFLIVLSTAVAILLQNVGQSVTPAAPAAVLMSLESVFGALFSLLFGMEVLTLRVGLGFLVVFAAVLLSVFPARMQKRPSLTDGR